MNENATMARTSCRQPVHSVRQIHSIARAGDHKHRQRQERPQWQYNVAHQRPIQFVRGCGADISSFQLRQYQRIGLHLPGVRVACGQRLCVADSRSGW